MMYDIQLKPRAGDDEGITILATEQQVEELRAIQGRGAMGTWIGKQYITFSSIRHVGPSSYQPAKPVTAPLLSPGKAENPVTERKRVRRRLNEMRQNLRSKGFKV